MASACQGAELVQLLGHCMIFCTMDPWGVSVSSVIMMVTLWTLSRHFIIWEKCWNIAREWLILYGSPTDRAGKSLRSWSIPLSCEEEMGMICSGEQKPSAGFEHVPIWSLITCFENCTCDILCGWWEWRAGSSLLSDTGSVFFQELKQTGVRSFWETLDRECLLISESLKLNTHFCLT